jgi:hypothetical protein
MATAAGLVLTLTIGQATADRAQWMGEGWFGIMVHYLIGPQGETPEERTAAFNATVNGFDLDGFMAQVESMGADWLIFTIGQNTNYYCSPNAYLDARAPGHTSERDLLLEIARACEERGIRLIAYLPSETEAPAADLKQAFGWNPGDQSEFQRRYTQFVAEYGERLGDLMDGWWFDGCYTWDVFPNSTYDWPLWFEAARAGNPDRIVCFNDGAFCIGNVAPVTPLEDYHAGEVHFLWDGRVALDHERPPVTWMPDGPFIDGVRVHALLPIYSTFEGGRPYVYSDWQLFKWVDDFRAAGGAVTLNLPVDDAGHIGDEAVAQVVRLRDHLGG